MNLQIIKRRVEMFDAVCTGLHPSAVISQLSEKYDVSEKVLRSDWLRRDKCMFLVFSTFFTKIN